MAEYTVKQGKTYIATVKLGYWESFASNEQVAEKFTNAGFEDVEVRGENDYRIAKGTWNQPNATADIPEQVTNIELFVEGKDASN